MFFNDLCLDRFGVTIVLVNFGCARVVAGLAVGASCARNHTVRNVWRALALGSVEPLGLPFGHLGRQGRPRNPHRFRLMAV